MLQRAAHLVQVFAQDRALFLHGPGQTIQCIIRAEDGGQSLISWSSMFTSMRIMTILYYRDFPLTAARAREDRRRALFSARGRCYLGASPRGNGQRIFCSLRPRCRLLRHPVEAGHAIMAAQLFLLPFVCARYIDGHDSVLRISQEAPIGIKKYKRQQKSVQPFTANRVFLLWCARRDSNSWPTGS